jgi:N-acetyl-anhydromuramyl-L-alanine amidase AmpD
MRSWFNNPAAFASSHFGVCKDGSVEQYVEVGDAAWHAGRLNRPNTNNPLIKNWLDNGINPNLRTVGVEMLLAPGERIGDYPLLVKAFDDLLLWLVAATGVAPDRVHIIGHNEIDSVNRAIDPICCWDINRGVKYVASRVATTPEEVTLESLAEQLDRVIERLNKAGIP